ncbi:hypothetical protein E4U22_002124 [Claviceps purpurea]|nr:hypothetical protein E4U22_002124 [Claviceps purpurea]
MSEEGQDGRVKRERTKGCYVSEEEEEDEELGLPGFPLVPLSESPPSSNQVAVANLETVKSVYTTKGSYRKTKFYELLASRLI